MTPKVSKISDVALKLGEGPHWDHRVQALYLVGIPQKTLHKYNYVTRTLTTTNIGTGGHGTSLETIEREKGSVYRLDESGIKRLADKINIPNGLAFDDERGRMYYIDSLEKKVRRYDYDVNTGEICNMRYHFDFQEKRLAGFPDGCTIDTEGNLWVAAFLAGSVLQISPEGELLQQVYLPTMQITSCTFGGPDLEVLFVTTGNVEFGASDGNLPYPASCTFQITGLGARGHPNVCFKLPKP